MAIKADSRLIQAGDTFVALSENGRIFIPDAIVAGAAKIVYSGELIDFVPGIKYEQVADAHYYFAEAVRQEYRCPDLNLRLLGVTGTNGKTTTVFLLRRLLDKCGMISTVEYDDGRTQVEAARTTPEPDLLFELLAKIDQNHLNFAAMELSSHALSQHRLGDARLACAIFTNLTGDHLDYHLNMDNYFAAKELLFSEYLNKGGAAVINIDAPKGMELAQALSADKMLFSFGQSPEAGYRIGDVILGDRSEFTLNGKRILTNLPGLHNIYNLTGALLAAHALGRDIDELIAQIADSEFVIPGRLESVSLPGGGRAFVDYAHTDDALRNVLAILRKIAGDKRVTVIFGCGGDRDKSKRSRMGLVAATLADKVIISSDNPRSEEPGAITQDIYAGVPEEFRNKVTIIIDRREAIKSALTNSISGEIILIAGKGHEKYQIIAGVRHDFDDLAEVKRLLPVI